MGRVKKYQPDQLFKLLRQIEGEVASGKSAEQAWREAGLAKQTCYRWRRAYGDLGVDQARGLKKLEKENANRKRLVGAQNPEKLVLKDIASGDVQALNFGSSMGFYSPQCVQET